MLLFNTLTAKKEKFQPLRKKIVRLYTCGPTVYDSAHIGNLRTYLFEDLLRRTLEYNGFRVKQVMNLTDIDDKIIKRAKKENKTVKKIAQTYAKKFFKDIKKLNIEKAEVYPKATAHIKEIVGLIKKLIKKSYAYQGRDNSIYFNISKFKPYGRLSKLDKQNLKINSRIKADEYNKEEARDFALWKAKKSGEPFWPSPWGKGRPGWHIECSAMSMKYLGQTFDIHAGGVDNIFPHHENEIAQSEAATGKKFVNCWLHAEHLLVDNQKMSKSLANFFTLSDLENRGFDPLAFRYLVLLTHYRAKLNFTWDTLEAAGNALNNLRTEIIRLKFKASKEKNPKTDKKLAAGCQKFFKEALSDDLNSPQALAVIWQLIKKPSLPAKQKLALLCEFDRALGLNLARIKAPSIPQKIRKLAESRERFRNNQQFIQADQLRKKIEGLGYMVEDTPSGALVIKRKR
jgi:cysteinyl-tRNA synthetase